MIELHYRYRTQTKRRLRSLDAGKIAIFCIPGNISNASLEILMSFGADAPPGKRDGSSLRFLCNYIDNFTRNEGFDGFLRITVSDYKDGQLQVTLYSHEPGQVQRLLMFARNQVKLEELKNGVLEKITKQPAVMPNPMRDFTIEHYIVPYVERRNNHPVRPENYGQFRLPHQMKFLSLEMKFNLSELGPDRAYLKQRINSDMQACVGKFLKQNKLPEFQIYIGSYVGQKLQVNLLAHTEEDAEKLLGFARDNAKLEDLRQAVGKGITQLHEGAEQLPAALRVKQQKTR